MKSPLIGGHVSIAGGMHKAIERALDAGFNCLQIFTKSASQWKAKPLTEEGTRRFREAWQQSGLAPVIAHDSYLINLASPEAEKRQRSIVAFIDEMQRCSDLGIPHLVMHPGAHMGQGEEAGLSTLVDSFHTVFDEAPPDVTVLLENTAGMGTVLGADFIHLSEVMERVPQGRFGVCLDTCHAFAAGYDFATSAGYDRFMTELKRLGCYERIEVIHVNDSVKGCGCRLDRHAHPGEGAIGEIGFRRLMQEPAFEDVPKILELPRGEGGELERRNLTYLRSLASKEN